MNLKKIFFSHLGFVIVISGMWGLSWLVEYLFFFNHWIQTYPFLIVPSVYNIETIIHMGFKIGAITIGTLLYLMLKDYFENDQFIIMNINNGYWIPKLKTFILGFECYLPICDQIKNLEQLETWKPFYIEFSYYSGKFVILFYFFNSFTSHLTQFQQINQFLERSFHEVHILNLEQLDSYLYRPKTIQRQKNINLKIEPEYFHDQNEFISYYNKVNQKLFKNEQYIQLLKPGESRINLKIQFWFFNTESIHFLWKQLNIPMDKQDTIAIGGRISIEEIFTHESSFNKTNRVLNIHIPPKSVLIPDKTHLKIQLLLYIFNKWTTNYFSIDSTNIHKQIKNIEYKDQKTPYIETVNLSEQNLTNEELLHTDTQKMKLKDNKITAGIPSTIITIGQKQNTDNGQTQYQAIENTKAQSKSLLMNKTTYNRKEFSDFTNNNKKVDNNENRNISNNISKFFNNFTEVHTKKAINSLMNDTDNTHILKHSNKELNNVSDEITTDNEMKVIENNENDLYLDKKEKGTIGKIIPTSDHTTSEDKNFHIALSILSENPENFAQEKKINENDYSGPNTEQIMTAITKPIIKKSNDTNETLVKTQKEVKKNNSKESLTMATKSKTYIQDNNSQAAIPDFKFTVVCRKYCKNFLMASQEKNTPPNVCIPFINKSIQILDGNFIQNKENINENKKLDTLRTIFSTESDHIQKTCILTTISLQSDLKKIFSPNEVYELLATLNQEANDKENIP